MYGGVGQKALVQVIPESPRFPISQIHQRNVTSVKTKILRLDKMQLVINNAHTDYEQE